MLEKSQEVYRAAEDLFNKAPATSWVTFYNEILGPEGIVRQLYSEPEALGNFQKSDEYARIQSMLVDLRKGQALDTNESTRVITVRLPETLHESLTAEAHLHQTSVNQLCISKLLQVINGEYVPKQRPSGPKATKAQSSAPVAAASTMGGGSMSRGTMMESSPIERSSMGGGSMSGDTPE